jgi:hypothetical protein
LGESRRLSSDNVVRQVPMGADGRAFEKLSAISEKYLLKLFAISVIVIVFDVFIINLHKKQT